jgi:hypothetical protein
MPRRTGAGAARAGVPFEVMIGRGPRDTGRRRRMPGVSRLAAAACPAIVAAFALAQCSAGGSDAAGVAAGSPFASGPGSLIQADDLGNTVVGGEDRVSLAYRFRAGWTGSVAAVRFYVITDRNASGRTGYSLGNGGRMRVSLRADSGRAPHVPTGPDLAATTFRPLSGAAFPLVQLGGSGRVVKGRLYHVVFTNVSSDATRNYVSINGLFSAKRRGRGPGVPDGMAVLERVNGGAWAMRRSRPHEFYLPILEVVGGRSGQRAGLGYMEVWDPKPIGAGAGVRQLIRTRAGGPTRVAGAWFRVRRAQGAAVPLAVALNRPSGESLASAAVPASDVPAGGPGWVHVRFAKPVSLPPDTDVALTASASSPSSFEAFPIRKGIDYGFDRTTYFDSGYAQFNAGDGWIGWDQWDGHDRHDSDLQFALDVVR